MIGTQYTEADVYGTWSVPETTTVTMPDGTPIVAEWQYRNEEDPEVKLLSAVSPDGTDYADHNVCPGVYDEIHLQLQGPARRALGPSRDEMLKLWKVVCGWRDRLEVTCGETIHQTDKCQIEAATFMGECIEAVGYGDLSEPDLDYVSPGI